jgi:hypothetical protein
LIFWLNQLGKAKWTIREKRNEKQEARPTSLYQLKAAVSQVKNDISNDFGSFIP